MKEPKIVYCDGKQKCKNVLSDLPCEICGFNPAEKKRRLETGSFREENITHELHNDQGQVVHVATNNCKKLYFKNVLE